MKKLTKILTLCKVLRQKR